ncbi:MAG: M48 family metalloprotease [Rhodanobacteraceae bacterium]|nr:M48 family metalloprotease [Rhodanobacteraceae bacterium]
MNFFAHQAAARAKSRRMLWLFALAVLAIVAAINVVVLLVFGIAVVPESPEQRDALVPALVASTAVTLAVIGLGSLFKTLSLRGGGGSVARSMGGTLVPGDPRDFQLKRLRNVIEEMSIASGVPVPEIYVLDRESGINAFAAGFAPSDAAIAVTRGALDRLSRDELQGVIAHEYSHILNGDMRLNLRLMGLIFGLLVLGLTGRKVLEHMRLGGSKKEGNAILLIALAVMIFGYLGVFLGRMIKAYISRQREYLADASAVQFTRLSHGLSGALMKIAAFEAGSRLTANDGEEVAHMLFGDGVGYGALTATHPPLIERIRRIDPRFDPQLLARLAATERSFEGVDEGTDPPAASALLAGFGATPRANRRSPGHSINGSTPRSHNKCSPMSPIRAPFTSNTRSPSASRYRPSSPQPRTCASAPSMSCWRCSPPARAIRPGISPRSARGSARSAQRARQIWSTSRANCIRPSACRWPHWHCRR